MSYEELFNDYTFFTTAEERILMIPDIIRVSVLEAIENSDVADDFKSRLENVSNAALKLYQSLRCKTSYALKKTIPVLPVRARARSYRSHRKTATASSSSGDDGLLSLLKSGLRKSPSEILCFWSG